MYVSNIAKVAAAVKASKTISSIFKDFLGIAKAAIATIKPSIKYLTMRLTSSVTSNIAISVYINKKEKIIISF
jgi:hypothetical protein